MTVYDSSANMPFGPGRLRQARGVALHPIHEAAMRLAGSGLNKSKGRTRDLVALLLSHGARAWRHSQPEASIHLHIGSQSDYQPVRLRLR